MLLVLVLALEQSSFVIQQALMRMMKVHLMPSEEHLMELGHRISAVMVRVLQIENLLKLDLEPLVAIVPFLFVHDAPRSLEHLPELHLLDLPVHP